MAAGVQLLQGLVSRVFFFRAKLELKIAKKFILYGARSIIGRGAGVEASLAGRICPLVGQDADVRDGVTSRCHVCSSNSTALPKKSLNINGFKPFLRATATSGLGVLFWLNVKIAAKNPKEYIIHDI